LISHLFIDAVKQGANIVLLIMMMMAVYSHYMVNDKFERIAPALVRGDIHVYNVCNMGSHDLYKEPSFIFTL